MCDQKTKSSQIISIRNLCYNSTLTYFDMLVKKIKIKHFH